MLNDPLQWALAIYKNFYFKFSFGYKKIEFLFANFLNMF